MSPLRTLLECSRFVWSFELSSEFLSCCCFNGPSAIDVWNSCLGYRMRRDEKGSSQRYRVWRNAFRFERFGIKLSEKDRTLFEEFETLRQLEISERIAKQQLDRKKASKEEEASKKEGASKKAEASPKETASKKGKLRRKRMLRIKRTLRRKR